MVPAGYMAKRVVGRPDWLTTERVSGIYSVSGCVSENFADYITFWKHNSLAAEIETNSRCLLESFEQARKLLEDGMFNNSEPGPYRIFAVYSVAWSDTP